MIDMLSRPFVGVLSLNISFMEGLVWFKLSILEIDK
jgi:hypothetical protein